MAALVLLRDKIIKPLFAAQCKLKRGRNPNNRAPIDAHYDAVQRSMRDLLTELGMTASVSTKRFEFLPYSGTDLAAWK
jgi:hypothetical protein